MPRKPGFNDKRQDYPIGDVDNGQFIQTNKSLRNRPVSPILVANEAVGLSVTTSLAVIPEGKRTEYEFARITVEVAAIRFFVTGSIPTSTVGEPAEIGDVILLETNNELQEFKAISRDGATATLQIVYGNYPKAVS